MPCANCCKCECHTEEKTWGTGYPAYKLVNSMPGAPAGTIFVLAPSEKVDKLSRTHWLTNAWVSGNCQSMGGHSWCGGVIVLPDTVLEETSYFQRIPNHGRYTI